MTSVSIMFQLSDAQVELLTKTDDHLITIDDKVIRLAILRPYVITDIDRNIDVISKPKSVEDKLINIIANLIKGNTLIINGEFKDRIIEAYSKLDPTNVQTVSDAKVFKDKHGNIVIDKARDSSGKFTKPDPNI